MGSTGLVDGPVASTGPACSGAYAPAPGTHSGWLEYANDGDDDRAHRGRGEDFLAPIQEFLVGVVVQLLADLAILAVIDSSRSRQRSLATFTAAPRGMGLLSGLQGNSSNSSKLDLNIDLSAELRGGRGTSLTAANEPCQDTSPSSSESLSSSLSSDGALVDGVPEKTSCSLSTLTMARKELAGATSILLHFALWDSQKRCPHNSWPSRPHTGQSAATAREGTADGATSEEATASS
eukprot:CAMPEP_0177236780 /NCGR_PEP_ID=MMETSP0367-20130122/45639_1 /TAXON_ID=447022 ORGANISM="Scrippsiella hangoei-like, Strain SHHI-4" /NCGR_SAMPLE_ID=MMETSP0367 /ASSEMBLY_ACC=CAM_ASM_000362 /LENGTH=235 /DNA_ID=CAMNT_0018687717 /DNA_START=152 /DNA_END=860 /DNA_ORIENTATION=-